MVVQINHLLVILLGKLKSSGHAQKRYIPIGAAACTIYLTVIFFFLFPSENFVIKLTSLPLFIGLYVTGIAHAKRAFKQTHKILFELIKIMYYSPTGKLDDNSTTKDTMKTTYFRQPISQNIFDDNNTIEDTMKTADSILSAMPQSNKEALMILLLFFDSVTTVFLISLINGTIRLKPFTKLNTVE